MSWSFCSNSLIGSGLLSNSIISAPGVLLSWSLALLLSLSECTALSIDFNILLAASFSLSFEGGLNKWIDSTASGRHNVVGGSIQVFKALSLSSSRSREFISSPGTMLRTLATSAVVSFSTLIAAFDVSMITGMLSWILSTSASVSALYWQSWKRRLWVMRPCTKILIWKGRIFNIPLQMPFFIKSRPFLLLRSLSSLEPISMIDNILDKSVRG